VGNRDALSRIGRILYGMVQYENHCCDGSDVVGNHPTRNVAFIGGPGTGKTTFARTIAKSIGLPFVEIQPQTIQSVNDILVAVAEVCEKTNINDETLELEETYEGSRSFLLPPIVIFIDEIHLLKDRIVQALLKATEPKDRTMVTEKGWTVDCQHVFWVIATTERGKINTAFDTRFTKITLNPYTPEEVAQIVNLKYNDWSMEKCRFVTKYGGTIPREVLPFAEDIQLALKMNGEDNWKKTIIEVAKQHGIDEYGMSFQRIEILKALAKEPISKNRLCFIAKVQEEELQEFIMPTLLTSSLVDIDSRGYFITDEGRQELNKRGINYV
jgi:Holliday junction resolvasome RuvABC ATP-dependent DNA helicase subunit